MRGLSGDRQALERTLVYRSSKRSLPVPSCSVAWATKNGSPSLGRAGKLGDRASLLPLDARVRILYNPNLDDLWFLVPGMASLILQTQSIALTAAAVVREREMEEVTVFVGGIIPTQDIPELEALGVAEVFLPGTSTEDVVRAVERLDVEGA